jgi:deazaflavin-dependent oxidoreductase (nitroreductase family)
MVLHRGRRSGRAYQTPVAARKLADGFVISLAFGAQVDWYRNLEAAGGGVIRWRGRDYEVSGPEMIDAAEALPAFDPVQRLFMRLAGIDGYIRVRDAAVAT